LFQHIAGAGADLKFLFEEGWTITHKVIREGLKNDDISVIIIDEDNDEDDDGIQTTHWFTIDITDSKTLAERRQRPLVEPTLGPC
jgi:hypothetical protein